MNTVKQIHLMTLKEYEATPEDERVEVFEGYDNLTIDFAPLKEFL